jgi:drug/metabolite transporter (DMT)-like permease
MSQDEEDPNTSDDDDHFIHMKSTEDEEPTKTVPTPAAKKDNLPLGLFLILLQGIVTSTASIAQDYMFLWNPDLTTFEVAYLKSLFSIPFLLLIVNSNLKTVVWDSIPKGQGKLIALRTLLSFGANSIQTYAISILPVGNVSIIYNINPVYTVLIGALFMKEHVTKY